MWEVHRNQEDQEPGKRLKEPRPKTKQEELGRARGSQEEPRNQGKPGWGQAGARSSHE